jgi:uncharacterized Zn finger protein
VKGNVQRRIESLAEAVRAGGLDRAPCAECGGPEPGTLGSLVVWDEAEIKRCSACGVVLNREGKPAGERVSVVVVHRPERDLVNP